MDEINHIWVNKNRNLFESLWLYENQERRWKSQCLWEGRLLPYSWRYSFLHWNSMRVGFTQDVSWRTSPRGIEKKLQGLLWCCHKNQSIRRNQGYVEGCNSRCLQSLGRCYGIIYQLWDFERTNENFNAKQLGTRIRNCFIYCRWMLCSSKYAIWQC